MSENIYDRKKLMKLASLAKQAFVPAPGGAPPMDPSMMGGMPPDPAMMGAGGMPADPSMMGGMPPDPAMMGAVGMPMSEPMMAAPEGGAPPMDPSAQAMGDQEMLRSMITPIVQQAIQEAINGGGMAGGPKKGGANKLEEQFARIEQKLAERDKILVAALRREGIEIPLADIMGMDNELSSDPNVSRAQQDVAENGEQPGLSEQLHMGLAGSPEGSQPGKIASAPTSDLDKQIDHLVNLARTGESLRKTAMGPKLVKDPRVDVTKKDFSYLEGLYR